MRAAFDIQNNNNIRDCDNKNGNKTVRRKYVKTNVNCAHKTTKMAIINAKSKAKSQLNVITVKYTCSRIYYRLDSAPLVDFFLSRNINKQRIENSSYVWFDNENSNENKNKLVCHRKFQLIPFSPRRSKS